MNPAERIDPSRRGWTPMVLLLLLVFIISYVDRQILSLVVQPLKLSLRISDTQIGMLQGPAFSFVMASAAIFGSPLIDRGNRVRLMAICMLAWCTMTGLSGFAQSFEMLLVSRVGLALAEGIVPFTAVSIICDIAPRAAVPRASALLMSAPYLGSGIALLLGGPLLGALAPCSGQPVPLIGTFEPWRGLFWFLAAPGVCIGLLMLVFVREPIRRGGLEAGDPSVSVFPFLKANIGFLAPLALSNSMLTMISYTIYAWSPTLMIRVHGMSPATAGVTVGTIFVTAGVAGSLLGGWVMTRTTDARALNHVVRTIAIVFACLTVPLLIFPMVPNPTIKLMLLALSFLIMATGLSSVTTPFALFAPANVRGRVLAMAGFVQGGLAGLGPLAVGALNDHVFADPARIATSMAITFAVACGIGLALLPRVVRLAKDSDDARSAHKIPNRSAGALA